MALLKATKTSLQQNPTLRQVDTVLAFKLNVTDHWGFGVHDT